MIKIMLMVLAIAGQLANGRKNKAYDLSKVTSEFSQRLYRKVALDKGSMVFSPFSIHSILTLTSLGAYGKTKDEMLKTLGVTSISRASKKYEEVIKQTNSNKNVDIGTGNAIFVKPESQIKKRFAKEAETKFSATTTNFDLSAPGGPEKAINDYIAEATKNLIKKVLSKGSITASTAMVLVNTIFFNGAWVKNFNDARNQTFSKSEKKNITIEMMAKEMEIKHKKDTSNHVQVAEIPFKGRRFALYIALPLKVGGIASLEQLISHPTKMEKLFKGLKKKRVFVDIPKFTTETTLDLKQPLIELGMVEAFGPGADFRDISSGSLSISDVLHKAKIEVKEIGVTAAAATVLQANTRMLGRQPQAIFVANHPFLYFLRDRRTGLILFQGKFSG
ncbi:antichymotrypsin-2-like [Physella acuta]|uniref:antichymotrypsin-2-like n=1 Tax=Physella acuta TaxID=109671 RepID=UPI0027DDC895|nr:antichymotrypsin-2-like [Physella acuta]